MKRFLATLLAAILLLACIPALAEADAAASDAQTYPTIGLVMDDYSIYSNCVNHVSVETLPVEHHDPYVAMARVLYYAMPLTDIIALEATAANDEERDEIDDYIAYLSTEVGYIMVSDAADQDAMLDSIGAELKEGMSIQEVATEGSWHYYYVTTPTDRFMALYDNPQDAGLNITEEEAAAEKERAAEEIKAINTGFQALIKECEHITPEDPTGELIGQTIRFETTDLDGNPVKSEDLFKNNKITLVNVWGTWCGACTGELGELAEIYKRLQEKGCGIVGVESEGKKVAIADVKDDAEALLKENNVTYPNVWCPEGVSFFENLSGYPYNYFVDSEGKILTFPICGAAITEYETVIDKLLAGEKVEPVTNTGAQANGESKYNVIVYDTDGKPVEGVVIQFCDDTSCAFQTTNAEGVATFPVAEAKVYDVHVLSAPDAYRQDEQSYKTLADFSDVTIFLDKAE